MTIQDAWVVRPKPRRINRTQEFLDLNIIAIGWPKVGDLTDHSRRDIRRRLTELPYYKSKKNNVGSTTGQLDRFANKMKIGDFVLIPDGRHIYFAEITSDYQFHKEYADSNLAFPHWRQVSYYFNKEPKLRHDLPDDLQSSLKCQTTVFSISPLSIAELIDKKIIEPPTVIQKTLLPPIYQAESLLKHIREIRGTPERNMEDVVKDILLRLGHPPSSIIFQAGRIDVSVMNEDGQHLFVVEVKRELNTQQAVDKARRQAFDYANQTGAPIVVITDSDRFEIYDRESGSSYEEQFRGSFRMTEFRPRDFELLDLLRPQPPHDDNE